MSSYPVAEKMINRFISADLTQPGLLTRRQFTHKQAGLSIGTGAMERLPPAKPKASVIQVGT